MVSENCPTFLQQLKNNACTRPMHYMQAYRQQKQFIDDYMFLGIGSKYGINSYDVTVKPFVWTAFERTLESMLL